MKNICMTGILAVFCLTAVVTWAQDGAAYKVVVNPASGQTTISAGDLKDVFLGRRKAWNAGGTIQPVVADNSEGWKAFLKSVLARSAAQFDTHWKRLLFSGQAVTPVSVDDDAAVVEEVLARKGGVGVVSAATDVKGLTVLAIQ